IQSQLNELKTHQDAFATRTDARISRIETSFTVSQENLILPTTTHLSTMESRLASIESASMSFAANSLVLANNANQLQ
ncbi:hypothetical protein HDU98_010342, partial [Podochytrium sp. JEL0797]